MKKKPPVKPVVKVEVTPLPEKPVNKGGRPKGTFGSHAPRQLKDMRHVYNTRREDDHQVAADTPGQALCRKVMHENPKEFLAQLNRLEELHRVRTEKRERVAGADTKQEVVSEFTAGMNELIGKLLTEAEQESA